MDPLPTVSLADDVVELRPLSFEHVDALARAAEGPRDTYRLTRVPQGAAEARAYVEFARGEQEKGVWLPLATFDARRDKLVGSTSFMTIERWTWPPPGSALQRGPERPDVVEIGATWLTPEAQRTAINTHAKLLMLRHAFEVWEVRRVTLKTDSRNHRSRAAIERLGARLDGVLRAHMPAFDGAVRDTAFYSIMAAEWPEVRARLEERAKR